MYKKNVIIIFVLLIMILGVNADIEEVSNDIGSTTVEEWDTKFFSAVFNDTTLGGWDYSTIEWSGSEEIVGFDAIYEDEFATLSGYIQFENAGEYNLTFTVDTFDAEPYILVIPITVENDTKLYHIENGVYEQYIGELQFDLFITPRDGEEIINCWFWDIDSDVEIFANDVPIVEGANYFSAPWSGIGSYDVACELSTTDIIHYPNQLIHWYEILETYLSDRYFTDKNNETWVRLGMQPQDSVIIEFNQEGNMVEASNEIFIEYDDFLGDYDYDVWDVASDFSYGVFIDNDYLEFIVNETNKTLFSNVLYEKTDLRFPAFTTKLKASNFNSDTYSMVGFDDNNNGYATFLGFGNSLYGSTGLNIISSSPDVLAFSNTSLLDGFFIDYTLLWKDNITVYINSEQDILGENAFINNDARFVIRGFSGTNASNITIDYIASYYQSDFITTELLGCIPEQNKCYVQVTSTSDDWIDDVQYNVGALGIDTDLGFTFIDAVDLPSFNLIDYTYDEENQIVLGVISFIQNVSRYLKIIENHVDSWASYDNAVKVYETFTVDNLDNSPYFCASDPTPTTLTGSTVIVNNTYLCYEQITTVNHNQTVEYDFRVLNDGNSSGNIILGLDYEGKVIDIRIKGDTPIGLIRFWNGENYYPIETDFSNIKDGEWHKLQIKRNINESSFYMDTVLLGTFEGNFSMSYDMFATANTNNGAVVEIDTIKVYYDDENVSVAYAESNNTELILNLTSTATQDANVVLNYYNLIGDLYFEWTDAETFSSATYVGLQKQSDIDSTTPTQTYNYTTGDSVTISLDWNTTNPTRELIVWYVDDTLINSYYTNETTSSILFDETTVGVYIVTAFLGEPTSSYTWFINVTAEPEEPEEPEEPVVPSGGGGGGSVVVVNDDTTSTTTSTEPEITVKTNNDFFSVLTGAEQENETVVQIDSLSNTVTLLSGNGNLYKQTLYNTVDEKQTVSVTIIKSKGEFDWVSLTQTEYIIPGYSDIDFEYTINVPENTPSGKYEVYLQIDTADASSEYMINVLVLPKPLSLVWMVSGGVVLTILIFFTATAFKKK